MGTGKCANISIKHTGGCARSKKLKRLGRGKPGKKHQNRIKNKTLGHFQKKSIFKQPQILFVHSLESFSFPSAQMQCVGQARRHPMSGVQVPKWRSRMKRSADGTCAKAARFFMPGWRKARLLDATAAFSTLHTHLPLEAQTLSVGLNARTFQWQPPQGVAAPAWATNGSKFETKTPPNVSHRFIPDHFHPSHFSCHFVVTWGGYKQRLS